MQRVQVRGFSLCVRVEGRAGGSPVLLLHGFPDNHSLWDKQVPALVAAGYRVIAPDLLGFGESERPAEVAPNRLHAQAAMLAELLDQLGVKKAAVVGHDWGAGLAWHFAMFNPERVSRLAALSVGCHGTFFATGDLRESMQQRAMSWYMLFFQFHPAAEQALSANNFALLAAFGDDPQVLAGWKADLSRPGALTAALNWYRANMRPEMFGRMQPLELPVLQMPVLGVWREETFLTEGQMKASQRYVAPGNWRYARLSGFGHFIPREAAEQLNPLLLDFLAGSPRASL